MLTERQQLILSAIVDDYIRSAEPIGSRSISKKGNVGFSPATIRNEMSDLEEMGFLEQPHTSAGRIPSQKGYRYYVDHLIPQGTLSEPELDMIKMFLAQKLQEIEQVFQQASNILSNLTNYTSIVLGPEVFTTTLKRLQIVPLNERSAVAILVTNTGKVENRTVEIPEGVSVDEIEKVVNIINAKLNNVPLLQFKSMMYSVVSSELGKYVQGYEKLLNVVGSVLEEDDQQDRIFISGTTNMLTQPEFRDVDKVKTIFDLFGESDQLLRMISNQQTGIQVKIGAENNLEAINNCSLITATYSIDDQPLGTVGILGPTRMEYGRVISLLHHVTRDLEIILGRWYK